MRLCHRASCSSSLAAASFRLPWECPRIMAAAGRIFRQWQSPDRSCAASSPGAECPRGCLGLQVCISSLQIEHFQDCTMIGRGREVSQLCGEAVPGSKRRNHRVRVHRESQLAPPGRLRTAQYRQTSSPPMRHSWGAEAPGLPQAPGFTERLSLKIFGCQPPQLPAQLQQQLTGWLSSAPSAAEGVPTLAVGGFGC